MTGEELRKFALTYIQTHPEYWKRWVAATKEWERQELMLEIIAMCAHRLPLKEEK